MTRTMDDLDSVSGNLRGKLLALAKSSASEESFIEYISSRLKTSDNLDVKALEIILDLTLAVVDQYGYVNFNYFEARNNSVINNEDIATDEDKRVPALSSYDGDDEDLDDTFIFPCHIMYDDCHPELLSDYHREHLKPSRDSAHIIKLPKLCEFVIEFMLDSFRSYITNTQEFVSFRSVSSQSVQDHYSQQSDLSDEKNDAGRGYLGFIIKLIKKINKVCLNERRNCRILAKTGTLNILLQNIDFLVQVVPEDQHIYLEPILKFIFTLADYRISGANLRQLFGVIKNEDTDLKIVLRNLERLLSHHYRILRNIQPSRSINFPVASKTPEEIEYDLYVSNSWHWRLRSKVIDCKRKRSRNDSQSRSAPNQEPESQSSSNINGTRPKPTSPELDSKPSSPPSSNGRISPSWLECSLITPLSNISPLIHNGEIKFCCSLWMSVCGDLLVVEGDRAAQRKRAREDKGDNFDIDWNTLEGHWLRLTSRRRLARRYKNKVILNMRPRKRRLSAKIRRRQAYDKEDEELEEIEEMVRKSDAEMSQGPLLNGRRFKLFHSSLRRQPKASPISKQRDDLLKKTRILDPKNKGSDQGPPREYLGRRARDNAQQLLIHLISFAMDSFTIEIWLNVKCMTFCARACRVTREGQTTLLDQVTFSSHLEANGSWSNIMFCFEESSISAQEKVMNFKVIVNGVHKEKEKLVYSAHKSLVTNFALLIGCERSTFGYVWKLSQINIYKSIPDKNMPIYLLGKGPDFWSFTNFRVQSSLPLPDITQRHMKNVLQPKVLMRYGTIDEDQALNWLTQNIVISYVAHQPEHFLDYSLSQTPASIINPLPADYEFSNSAERFIQAKTLDFSRALKFNQNNGFGSALVEAGGIESVLMSFAEVVRRSPEDPQAHALAFSVLLKMSQTNLYHLNKFLDELNGLKLAEYILTHPKCKVSKPMLESYLDYCLMWHRKSTRCLIKSPKLIYHIMAAWRAWHKDARVARLLYRRLIKLLQPVEMSQRTASSADQKLDSYYISHNFSMMTQAGGIDILIDVLRECLVSADENQQFINHDLIELIVNLISLLIRHPPRLDVMLDIMEFLLFLHPDPKAYVEVTHDRAFYLHPILCMRPEKVVFDEPLSGVRTPYSETESEGEPLSGYDNNNGRQRTDSLREVSEESSESNHDGGNANSLARSAYYSEEEDDFEASYEERISNQCSRDLADIIEKFNTDNKQSENHTQSGIKMAWIYGELNRKYEAQHKLGDATAEPARCSNRNFALANIADMLASMVKLISTDPMRILSEALQKHIIDPRKLIILANNESPLVREKVLRLFLYCVRACYTLNLKSVLASYEQGSRSENYNICVPIHLMARQLLRYTTTSRMVQLCYGIIVGVDDFETVDTVCLIFDIEILNNHLELNTLVLLMQLITRLRQPKEIESALQFVHAYIKQLMQLGQETIVSILITNNLIDCVMSLYFSYVETTIARDHQDGEISPADDDEENPENQRKTDKLQHEAVVFELDKLLILIVRFFIQSQSSAEMNRSIDELLLHFDLLNTHVPIQYQYLLRDRKVKILMTLLRYCKHYEESAKRKPYNKKWFGLIRNSDQNRFNNFLSDHELYEQVIYNIDRELSPTNGDLSSQQHHHSSEIESENDANGHQINGSGENVEANDDANSDDGSASIPKDIDEKSIIERFKTAYELVLVFVTTRDPGIIPRPRERNFVMSCLKLLARHLNDCDRSAKDSAAGRSVKRVATHWDEILRKLEPWLKSCFSRLILYLLSPCDAMNLDERKYNADQILNMFEVSQLLFMLEENSSRSNHKVLLVFIKDLIEYCPANEQDGSTRDDRSPENIISEEDEDDDEIFYETEFRLRQLIRGLEYEVDEFDSTRKKTNQAIQDSRLDQKYRAIWLADLAQAREDLRDRLASLRIEFQCTNGKQGAGPSIENLTASLSEENDKYTDDAITITKEVVNDKHEQRKAYLEDVKQNKIYNYHIRQQWLSIIMGHSHERAIWYMEEFYPKSWELNPVEGPSRTRRRLRPCKLKLESRFLRHPARPTSAICEARTLPLSGRDTPNYCQQTATNTLIVDDWYSQYSPHPLCSLIISNEQTMDSNELRIRMFTTDKIHFNCDCSIIRPNEVCCGEVSIASWCIHFIGERSEDCVKQLDYDFGQSNLKSTPVIKQQQQSASNTPTSIATRQQVADGVSFAERSTTFEGTKSLTISTQSLVSTVVEDLWFDEIVEIWDRRYQLQDVGLEIFLTNNMTYLLSFRNNRDREDFKQNLMREQHKMINLQRFNLTTSLNRVTQMWRDGKLTNFDYLTCLNKLAGRSFNDLMQYPIFPFVLSNYDSDSLDLNDSNNFRNLKRPMAIQNEEREDNFKDNYQMSKSSSLNIGALGLTKPYHYGNHYSNSATVLHFLVRLPPFTQMLIQYQDNNFDQPDRTFHAISNTWHLITRDSNTDFKELIPEFYFLPEMFLNIGELELGRKQNNELVNDVKLPAWCPNSDARLFTLIHRQALESPHVSENLHNWIDLIFGYKQTGKAAVDAVNVFHPATYYGGIDLSGQHQRSTSSTATDSLYIINLTIANRSARSLNIGSDNISSTADLPGYPSPVAGAAVNSSAETNSTCPVTASDQQSPRRLALTRFHQADIERSALETMIKTYGQMPRQLFSTPMKQRSPINFAQQIIEGQLDKQQQQQNLMEDVGTDGTKRVLFPRKVEPMKQVHGLRWGSYVGSPSDNDIIAVKHKRIILEKVRDYRSVKSKKKSGNKESIPGRDNSGARNSGAQQLSKQSDKFHFCLLANGDVAILRNNTSLMLDYRADRKSSGIYQLSVPSARYSRRAGLSRVSRMNLFSNMIISRQQFSFLEPIYSPAYKQMSPEAPTATLSTSSLVATLSGARVKFSLDSLNLVSWLYLDGTIRVKHPAVSSQKPSIPLVQANTIVDTMSTCASVPELNLLLVGYNSGSICAHIVSTTYETSPLARSTSSTISTGAASTLPSATAAAALSASSAAPSAVHFLHTMSDGNSALDAGLLGPGRVTDKTSTGEPYTAVSLAGKTLQSVRSMNRTTRWLYCHSKRITCIMINVSFGIVVTASADGTSVIWDLNSLTFVRTIDYKLKSLRMRADDAGPQTPSAAANQSNSPADQHSFVWAYGRAKKEKVYDYLCNCCKLDRNASDEKMRRSASRDSKLDNDYRTTRAQRGQKCYICASGVDLIAISDTLGDIATVKHLSNRRAAASEFGEDSDADDGHAAFDRPSSEYNKSSNSDVSEAPSGVSSNSSSSSQSSLTSVIYVHTINGALVNFVDCHNQVTAVSYSNAPEGVSINVIVVGMVDGLIRLYSSWDLSRVKEFRVSGLSSPINDVMYTRDSQLMYIAYEDGQMVVLRNKRKGSISMPKEWIL